MRTTLALVFVLNAQPALAACHHYSSWSYPWPQSCKVSTPSTHPRRTWFVEVTAPPPTPAPALDETDDPARARALDALKQELRLHSVQTLELQTIGLTMEEKRYGD